MPKQRRFTYAWCLRCFFGVFLLNLTTIEAAEERATPQLMAVKWSELFSDGCREDTYRGWHLRQGLAFLQSPRHCVHPGQWSWTQTTHTNRKKRRTEQGVKKKINAYIYKCTRLIYYTRLNLSCVVQDIGYNIQEMSGTACSDTWGLCSSSDLVSDRVSPCNLQTTHNTYTTVHIGSWV